MSDGNLKNLVEELDEQETLLEEPTEKDIEEIEENEEELGNWDIVVCTVCSHRFSILTVSNSKCPNCKSEL